MDFASLILLGAYTILGLYVIAALFVTMQTYLDVHSFSSVDNGTHVSMNAMQCLSRGVGWPFYAYCYIKMDYEKFKRR